MKKYMKYMFIVAMLTTSINVFSQTTTVTYKPNATIGKDAVIKNGIAEGYQNYGSYPELAMWHHTPNFEVASYTAMRSLLKFDGLNTIPSNSKIISAEFKLFGVPSSTNIPGGNYYPTNFVGFNNAVSVYRITSAWNENTVTWNTKPTTDETKGILIPASRIQWNRNYTINSSNASNFLYMLNAMIGSSANNNGFMMQLLSESSGDRSMLFASSDHSNSALWPELTVTYEIIDCTFTTCVSTTDQSIFTFSAVNTYGNHTWKIYDINEITTTTIETNNLTSFNYTFPQVGNYDIVHIVNTANQSCTTSVSLCVDQTQISNMSAKTKKVENISDDTNNDALIPIDIIKENLIKVYPNPSSDDWNVTLTSEKVESVDVIVTDCLGKIVSNDKKNLTKGDNSFVLDGSKLPKGIYVLEIKGETTNVTQKLSKN